MNKPAILFFSIFSFTACFGQSGIIADETVTLLRYGSGLPDLHIREQVALKYHIKLVTLGDCRVTKSFQDSIAQYNKTGYEKLDQINGPNWLQEFAKDVEIASITDSIMIEERFREQLMLDSIAASENIYLGGRNMVVNPAVNETTETGKVVVEITVDRQGNVIKAVAGTKGSTTQSAELLKAAKEAALKAKFNADPEAEEQTVGNLIFTFKLE